MSKCNNEEKHGTDLLLNYESRFDCQLVGSCPFYKPDNVCPVLEMTCDMLDKDQCAVRNNKLHNKKKEKKKKKKGRGR